MAKQNPFDEMQARFKSGRLTRILAFGSSNTEHFLPGMHWFDVFDLAVCHTCGRIHRCINTGIGGNTASDLLARFEDDAAFYKPHVAIITIGGNDSNPGRNISETQFMENLYELKKRFTKIDCPVVFQTYYSPVVNVCGAEHMEKFFRYMGIIREVAAKTGSGLVDHLTRWERLRKAHPEKHLPLMQDGMHLNRRGNKVLGIDLARRFYVQVKYDWSHSDYDPEGATFWNEAIEVQKLMDDLEASDKS